MAQKYGWRLRFEDSSADFDYAESMEEPYDTEAEAEEAAAYAQSCMRLGADMFNLSNPGDYPETGADIDTGEVEIFAVD